MKLYARLLLTLLPFVCLSQLRSEGLLEGRWISTKVENFSESNGTGTGWTVEFRSDGTFREEIDEGFGIVEVWEGTYSRDGQALEMQRQGFRSPWKFTVEEVGDDLKISRGRRQPFDYSVTLVRSDAENESLAKLPRWPKTKAEAVEILKGKMSEEDLKELAATPKDELGGKYHFGLGLYIRNGFGIWRGNKPLWDDLTHGEPTHPDDLSGIIIDALWEDLLSRREDYPEYLALSELYDTLAIEPLPIRSLTPQALVDGLNERITWALRQAGKDPETLILKLIDPDPDLAVTLNSLPMLKVWGQSNPANVLLKDCFRGFSVELETPSTIKLFPLKWTGWFNRRDERTLYTKVDYQGDYFEVATEVSSGAGSLSSSLPGIYSSSEWTMAGQDAPLAASEIVGVLLRDAALPEAGKIMEISSNRVQGEESTAWSYRISTYLRPINSYKPKDSLGANGGISFKNGRDFFAKGETYVFDERSKWLDPQQPPALSRSEALAKLRDYLASAFDFRDEPRWSDVNLQRVSFTDYWVYDIRQAFGEQSRITDLRAFVTLSGNIIPFAEQK